jgi:hypothetical protein
VVAVVVAVVVVVAVAVAVVVVVAVVVAVGGGGMVADVVAVVVAVAVVVVAAMRPRVLRNRVRCKLCGDVIESLYRHHFVKCRCGKTFTDGGLDYVRRTLDDRTEDLSEYEF